MFYGADFDRGAGLARFAEVVGRGRAPARTTKAKLVTPCGSSRLTLPEQLTRLGVTAKVMPDVLLPPLNRRYKKHR